jgi:glycosyltransferase 2 family protein
MNPRIAKGLRYALTALVIGIIASRVDGRALGRTFASLGLAQIVALLLLVGVQQLLLTQRFATVLRGLARGASPRLRDLLIDQQVGTAYNVILPSAVGGDVIRALRAQRRVGEQAAEAWGAVLLDRLLGLLALTLIPLFGLALDARSVPNVLLRTAAGLVILLAPLTLFAGRVFKLAARALSTWPRLAKFAGDLALVLDAAPASLRLFALAWSLAYQIAVSAFFHVAAASFGIAPAQAFPAIWIGLPLVFVLSVLPITIGGLGLRESLFVGVLGLYGVSAEAALALALLWGAQGLLTAIAGVIAVWCEKPRASAAL